MQDHDSVHTCQALITKYLLDISCKVDQMHEFTDGCAVQYNSRHCVGDLSCSLADFGFIIQRNYFETSHAKGEQDAAGSHVKQKVSQAVLTRSATINNAQVKGYHCTIAADDDPMYDFYLLKLTSEGVEELDENYTDDYEFTALRGTRGLKGHFYL